jgi:hypothetical protein
MENEKICPISRYLDCFASLAGDTEINIGRRSDQVQLGGLDCFAALAMTKDVIPYTLTPTPYRWCAHVSAIKINNLQGQKRDMSAMTTISFPLRFIAKTVYRILCNSYDDRVSNPYVKNESLGKDINMTVL